MRVRRVFPVELAEQRGPFEEAAAARRLQALVRMPDDFARRILKLHVARERGHLELARALETKDVVEALRNARADREEPVVAQHHDFTIAEVLDETFALV